MNVCNRRLRRGMWRRHSTAAKGRKRQFPRWAGSSLSQLRHLFSKPLACIGYCRNWCLISNQILIFYCSNFGKATLRTIPLFGRYDMRILIYLSLAVCGSILIFSAFGTQAQAQQFCANENEICNFSGEAIILLWSARQLCPPHYSRAGKLQ